MKFGALVLFFVLPLASAVVPTGMPVDQSRLELIKYYFNEGFKYIEIVLLLLVRHGIKLCVRQLKRILRSNNMHRRFQNQVPLCQVEDIIMQEIQSSGQCLGYRAMWRRLVRDHGLRVKRNDVLNMMKVVDPEGVQLRKAHRLKRRVYCAKGPNYVWHMDGYDKLKPFGFCIHGCIDGYSRRIMWLEVSSSNNNPGLIATYYMDTLKQTRCAPRMIRSDYGTENTTVAFLQPLFRYEANDSMAGSKSFMYGKSMCNQRIEAWWGILRRQGVHWWINMFKDLIDAGMYDSLDPVHAQCLKFCFMDVIQAELDRIAMHWNVHEIRAQKRYSEMPHGKPDIMYFIPELYGGHDYGTKVDLRDVEICKEMYGIHSEVCCQQFMELAYCLKPNLLRPKDPDEALHLFFELIHLYDRHRY